MTNVQTDRDSNLRPWIYTNNGLVVYRAFSIGECIRSLVASRLGETPTPPPDYMKEVFVASGGREEEAIAAYEEEFGVEVDRQAESELMIADNIIVRGHMDGLVPTEILEVKWLSEINFQKYLTSGLEGLGSLGRKYAWQAGTYGWSRELPVRFLIGNKGVDKNDPERESLLFGELYEPSDLVSLVELTNRVDEIERYAEMDELPDCDAKCGKGSFFAHVHFYDNESGFIADGDLGDLIRQAYEMKVLLEGDPENKEDDGLIGKFEALKTAIKSHETGVHVAGPFSANVIEKKGSQRLDSKRLKKERPELYDEFSYLTAPSRSVILKKVSGAKGGQSTVL